MGLTLDEAIWDHSIVLADWEFLLKERIIREFSGGVGAIPKSAELVSDEHLSIDDSLIPARALHSRAPRRIG